MTRAVQLNSPAGKMGSMTVATPAALLTVDTVCAYVAERLGSLPAALLASSKLTAREVHGGNVNYAFEVTDDAGSSVFVKQAPPFFKVLGSDAPLHRERMQLEAMEDMATALGERASEFLPGMYLFDPESMVFVSEFLRPHRSLQESLYAGEASLEVAANLGTFMGLLHSRTHCSRVDPEEAERFATEYANGVLRDVHLDLVFTRGFREDERAAHLRTDAGFMGALQELIDLYAGADASNLALLHGDFHGGGVMAVTATGSAKVIDPEFCVYGPPGWDVGVLMSTYALAYCQHVAIGSGRERDVLAAIWQVWASYSREMLAGGVPAGAVEASCREAAGFAGCEVARTALGMAWGRITMLPDAAAKAEVERQCVAIGAESIVGRRRGVRALTEALERYGSY